MSYLEELFGLSGQTAVVIGGTGELCGTMASGLAKAGAAERGFMLSSQGKASKALPEARKFRRDTDNEFFI